MQMETDPIARAATADDAYSLALSRMCRGSQWTIGHVFVSAGGAGDLVSSRIWHIARPGAHDAVRLVELRAVTEAVRVGPGQGLAGRAMITHAPTWASDIAEYPTYARQGVAWETGIRGAAAFPVVDERRVLAVVELFSDAVIEMDLATHTLGVATAAALAERLAHGPLFEEASAFAQIAAESSDLPSEV
jgi:GAF domain